jgi:hypothetical protein
MITAVTRRTHTIGITSRLLAPTVIASAASSQHARTAPIPTEIGLP